MQGEEMTCVFSSAVVYLSCFESARKEVMKII